MGRLPGKRVREEVLKGHRTGQRLSAGWRDGEVPPSRVCRGFTAHSLARAFSIWKLKESGREEPSEGPLMWHTGPLDGCDSSNEILGDRVASHLDTSQGLISLGYMVLKDLKRWMIPGTSLKMCPEASTDVFFTMFGGGWCGLATKYCMQLAITKNDCIEND